jgi:hypothetical protein
VTLNRLFHYQRFTEEHFVSLLSEGKLKLSAANQFNDPWDCRVHYRIPTDSEGIKRTIRHWKELDRKHHPEITKVKRAIIAYDIQCHLDKLETALLKTEELLYGYLCKQYRIYCLSEKCDVALMWGHYASAHTGVCLEFDAKQMPFSRAGKVTYLSSYPAWDIVDGAYGSLFTKSMDWSYEAEWRLIAEERAFARSSKTIKTDNDFLVIPSGVLQSVTIGCRADTKTRRLIEILVNRHAPSVVVRHATLARDRYALEITPPVS